MPTEITVLIADDHPIFRQGLKQVIAQDPLLRIVAEAEDGVVALDRLSASGARIAVLDIDMPNKDGFEVVRALRAERRPVEVVFLTMHRDARFFAAALDLGVRGYVLKDSALSEIVQCIHAVAAGQAYVSPELLAFLSGRHRRTSSLAICSPGIDRLTPSERRVLGLIAQCKMSRDIGTELNISVRTVEHHRANIAEKLQLAGPNALLKFALEHRNELS
jgi:DNA-binding NarL/FixJ family response regulator